MTIIYRILSFLINIVAVMLLISLIGSSPMLFSSPQTMLSAFLMIAVIMYSWFSSRFRREVLQQQKVVKSRLRDWIRVNGIVTLVFSVISIIGITPLLSDPLPFIEAMQPMGVKIATQTALLVFTVMLIYAIFLLIHILWTFALMQKNIWFFQEVEPEE